MISFYASLQASDACRRISSEKIKEISNKKNERSLNVHFKYNYKERPSFAARQEIFVWEISVLEPKQTKRENPHACRAWTAEAGLSLF